DVKTVKPDTEVDQLIHTMIESSHLGYPVVDDEGEVLGIVTLEDLQRSSSEGSERVEDIMTSEITSIHLSQGAGDAFNKMTDSDLGRLVVVDNDDQLVGIITRSDIFNALKVTGAIPEREEGPLPEGEGKAINPAGGLFGKSEA
ncbi:MAG: CBS domain-containing protein, partial [Candidatus Bipolaricaulia bacterium]